MRSPGARGHPARPRRCGGRFRRCRLQPERQGGAGHRRRPRDRLRDGPPDAHARRLGRGPRPRRRARPREAAERIGARAIGIGADVTDQGAMMAAVAEVVEKLGGLDVAVANAGIAQKQFATVRGISGEEWERVFEVDLLGVWRTVRAALPQIVERRGQMVVVSSVYAFANGMGNTPLRGRQGRGRVARPGAAGRARPARRQRHRRLLRLGRHQTRPGRLRPGRRRPHPRPHPRLPAQADHPRRGRRRPRPRHRGTRPARLRPQVVALRLRLPRPDQPAARQAAWRATPRRGR